MRQKKYYIFLALLILIFIQSCKKDFNKITNPTWEPTLISPILKTNLTLYNLLEPDSNLIYNEDSTIKIIYSEDSLFSISADDVFEIADQSEQKDTFKLKEIEIENFSFKENVLLSSIISYLNQEAQDSINSNAGTIAVFPPMLLQSPYSFNFNSANNYNFITYSAGYLLFSITDSLPVSLNDLEFNLIDAENGNIIHTFNFPLIEPYATLTDSFNLAGLTISNTLTTEIQSLTSPGSYPEEVPINLDDGVVVKAMTKNIKVVSGEAKIPEQLISSKTTNIDFDISDSAELKQISLSSAFIHYHYFSSIQSKISLELKLTSATINGEIPSFNIDVYPGESGTQTIDISNIIIDLTTDTIQPYNILPFEYKLIINSSATMIPFDTSNFISFDFVLDNLRFSYVKGYFGKYNVNIDEDTLDMNIDFFNNFEGGLKLDNPKIKFDYTNSIGVPISLKPFMTGISKHNNIQNLNKDTIHFNYPEEVGQIINDSIIIDKTNSDIVDLIAISPSTITYSANAFSNNFGSRNNFIYDSSEFTIGISMDLPLKLSTGNLVFQDTLDINFEAGDYEDLEEVSMFINTLNGFPLGLDINIIMIDSINHAPIDTISTNRLEPAIVDENGKVIEATESNITISLNKENFNNLEKTENLILKARINTSNYEEEQAVTLYTFYSINFNIGIKAHIKTN